MNRVNKILITGSTGSIGSRLIEYLLSQENIFITATTRSKSISSNNPKLHYVTIENELEFNYNSVCTSIDCIIHLAAVNAINSQKDPLNAYQVNCISTGRLYKAALDSKVSKFLYFSTAHVYGESNGIIDENKCLKNEHPYAASHRAAEDLIKSLSLKGELYTIIIRLSNSFGLTSSNTNENLLINDLTKQAATTRNLIIKSNYNYSRNFITLTDVCRATHHLILISSINNLDIFNLGGDKSFTIYEIAELIKSRSDLMFNYKSKILLNFKEFNINEKVNFKYDITKIKNTNFKLLSNFNEEIDILLKYYNKNT